MKNKKLNRYYIFSIIGILAASFYPLYMGVCVVGDMLTKGTVMKEDYPKYIIPYTPISLALIVGVLLMPLLIKYAKRMSLLLASVISLVVFFGAELLLEKKVIVTSPSEVYVIDWQMYSCMVPAFGARLGNTENYIRQSPIEILTGNYNPAFKMHFYVISIVLILSVLNCFYGFAHVMQSGDKKRLRTLIMQAVSCAVFLGLCILACFTAFFRDGEIQVSFISALLMTIFFILLGVTVGIYAASFLEGKNKWVSMEIPAVVSSFMTALMYVGEMILLKGYLYRFGSGFLFQGLFKGMNGIQIAGMGNPGPAPIDLIIILASGFICAGILKGKKSKPDKAAFEKEDEL